jgi:hypothetical protein
MWGGVEAKAEVQMEELRTHVVDRTPGLERSIAEGCTREAFPVVVCAGMEFATAGRGLPLGEGWGDGLMTTHNKTQQQCPNALRRRRRLPRPNLKSSITLLFSPICTSIDMAHSQ